MATNDPLHELLETADQYLYATRAECDALPGHESNCNCPTHLAVRTLAEELETVIKKIRGA